MKTENRAAVRWTGRLYAKAGRLLGGTVTFLLVLLCAGCGLLAQERIKLRDLDFTILGEEMLPAELTELIEEKKQAEFQFTYNDKEHLYICIGYGEQETGGYSIAVNELYVTDNAIYVSTQLLGPGAEEKKNPSPSCPYIVIKTECLEQTVIFE